MLEGQVQILARVPAGDVEAQALLALLHAGIRDRDHHHAVFEQRDVHEERLALVAAHHRHDVGVALTEIEADLGEPLPHVAPLFVELRDEALSVVLEHREDRGRGGDDGHGQARAEEKRSRVVLDVLDDVLLPDEDPADAAEGLGEGADDERHAPLEAVFFHDALPRLAEGAGAVGVVEDQERVVLLAELDDLDELRLVAVEGVDPLDQHDGVLALLVLQDALEGARAVVVEEANLGLAGGRARGEERTVEDAGVAEVVEDERRVLVGQAHDGADHRLVAGGEEEALLEAEPVGEALLELHVGGGRRLDARGAEPDREAVDGFLRRLLHLRVVGEAEVVVRAEVDDRLAVDRGVQPARLEGAEVRVDLLVAGLADSGELFVRLFFEPAHGPLSSPPPNF